MIINQNLSMFPIIDFSPLFYLKKEEDYKVHKPYDKYFKRIIDISGEGLLELIGFPIKIKHIHDSEKINEISGELHIDKLIESEDGKMYIIEFQKRPMTKKDLRRFGSYQSLVYKQTGKETIVIVISLSAKEDSDNLWGYGEFFERNSLKENNFQNDLEHYKSNNIDLYWLNIEYGFTPHVKSLTSMNFSLNLNIIEKIVENREIPSGKDLARLFLIPLMTDDEDKQKELILKTAELTAKLDYLDKNLLIDIKTNQILLAQRF